MNDYPDKFYAKTWTMWACAIIFGCFSLFGCIAGPLFWCDIMQSANGKPGYEAGIPLTTISYLFMLPYFVEVSVCLYVHQKPVISLYREGTILRQYEKYRMPAFFQIDILGLQLFLRPLFTIWRLITFQKLIETSTLKVFWNDVNEIAVTKTFLAVRIRIAGENHIWVSFDQNIFERPSKVGIVLEHCHEDIASHVLLPSWENQE